MDRREDTAGREPMTYAEARQKTDEIKKHLADAEAAFAVAEAAFEQIEAYPGGLEAFRIDFPEQTVEMLRRREVMLRQWESIQRTLAEEPEDE